MMLPSLFVFILCLLSTTQANVLTIEERPANGIIQAVKDSTLKLTCLVPSSQILNRIYWFVPGRSDMHVTNTDVLKSPYVQVEDTIPPRLTLFVRGFSTRDQGRYFCRFYDRSDASSRRLVAEQSVDVTLISSIRVVTADPDQWLRAGATGAIIQCQLEGMPPPNIVWLKGSKELRTDAKYTYVNNGLQLTAVTWEDAGKYVCRAERRGAANAYDLFIDVRVFQKPTITQVPMVIYPQVLTAGYQGIIECKATGKPAPKIFWFKQKGGDQELRQLDPQRYFSNPNTGRLKIFNVNFEKDTDVFYCVAALTSRAVKENVQDMMTRVEKFLQVQLWPSFFHQDRPLNQYVDLGKTVQIVCSVRANGRLQLQFQKFGDPYPYTTGGVQEDTRITVTQRQDAGQPLHHYLTLEIRDTKTTDSSNYTCIATNLAGNSSINGTVKVEHVPWMANMSNIHMGWIRNGTNLTCISYGFPFPTWSWLRHGVVSVITGVNKTFHVFSYDYDRYSQSWLQIRPDFGMERWIFDFYTCRATNRKGTGSREVEFRPASIPGAPRLAQMIVSSSSVTIEVNPPEIDGGMSILYYETRYRALGSAQRSWYGPVRFPVHFKMQFSGLMADTEYTFEIRARNLVGPSQDPLILRPRTKAMSPPSKVKVISSPISTYPYTYFLRWRVPHNGGEPLDGYRIQIRPVGRGDDWREFRPLFDNPNLSGFYMIDLEGGTKYDLNIQAHSIKGYGPPSRFQFRTPKADAFGKPPRVRGGAGALLASMALIGACGLLLLPRWLCD